MKVNNPIRKLKVQHWHYEYIISHPLYYLDGCKININKNRAVIPFSDKSKWFRRKDDNYQGLVDMLLKEGIISKVIPYRQHFAIVLDKKFIEII